MNQWYWRAGSRLRGPLTFDELVFLRERGKILPEHELRRGDRDEWIAAGRIRELFAAAGPARGPVGDQAPTPNVTSAKREPAAAESTGQMESAPTLAASEAVSSGLTRPSRSPSTPNAAFVNAGLSPTVRTAAGRKPVGSRDAVQADDDGDANSRTVAIGAASALGALLLLLLVLLVLLLGRRWSTGGGGEAEIAGQGGGAAGSGAGAPAGGGVVETTHSSPSASSDSRPANTSPPSERIPKAEEPRPTPPNNSPTKAAKKRAPPQPTYGIRSLPTAASDSSSAESTTAGSLGDFQGRLEREGAGSGDVQISLLWNDYNDVDLHVKCPSGEVITFNHPTSRCGGRLDVDMNAAGGHASNQPVENVFWPSEGAPRGEYQVLVHFFAPHVSERSSFEVAVKVNGNTRKFRGTAVYGVAPVLVHRFRR